MTSTNFSGKVALVTGASGGIGAAIALRLAAGGASVVCHYHNNRAGGEAAAKAIQEAGGTAIAVGGDVSAPTDVARIIAAAVQAFDRLDILINNAGISTNLAFGEVTAEAFLAEFNANVLSVVLMTQAAAEHFPADGARVVNVASNLCYGPLPGLAIYSAAKAAIISLTQGYARELGARKIAVNAVAPGATRTPMTAWLPEDLIAGISAATPLGRIADPDDVARAVAFLASDDARWVNGRTLIVDGGLV